MGELWRGETSPIHTPSALLVMGEATSKSSGGPSPTAISAGWGTSDTVGFLCASQNRFLPPAPNFPSEPPKLRRFLRPPGQPQVSSVNSVLGGCQRGAQTIAFPLGCRGGRRCLKNLEASWGVGAQREEGRAPTEGVCGTPQR